VFVRSLALLTELGLTATRGKISDRGNYLVVETPDDPGYYYGNLLVLPAPPQVGEVAYWTRRFAEELGGNPAIRHVTLWWDGVSGDAGAADELRAAGFTIETNQVMVADEVLAPPPDGIRIAPLDLDQISRTADLAWSIGDRHDESYRRFLHRRAEWHQRLVTATRGRAAFFGGFDERSESMGDGAVGKAPRGEDGSTLVASLGIVPLGALARYQDVQTAPAYRRRGIASALLAAAARHVLDQGVERVVVIAEPASEAARLYARVGFRTIERTTSACRYPADATARRSA